jgi:hypothetical protein
LCARRRRPGRTGRNRLNWLDNLGPIPHAVPRSSFVVNESGGLLIRVSKEKPSRVWRSIRPILYPSKEGPVRLGDALVRPLAADGTRSDSGVDYSAGTCPANGGHAHWRRSPGPRSPAEARSRESCSRRSALALGESRRPVLQAAYSHRKWNEDRRQVRYARFANHFRRLEGLRGAARGGGAPRSPNPHSGLLITCQCRAARDGASRDLRKVAAGCVGRDARMRTTQSGSSGVLMSFRTGCRLQHPALPVERRSDDSSRP